MKAIVYLHGFLSSPASRKARQLGDQLRAHAPQIHYAVPSLHHHPRRAIEQAAAAASGIEPADLALVGSSLGGFYATVLAERLGCPALVINPAVHPQRLLRGLLGPQRNPYTGEAFEITHDHVIALEQLDPAHLAQPSRHWLLVETGDEVLDYRDAVAYYAGARQDIIPGGDHTPRSFRAHLPEIVRWACAPATRPVAP